MARRPFTDRDHTLTQDLLDKVRRTASNSEGGNVLYDPQAFETLKPSFGHKSLTLAFMRTELGSVDKLQKAVIDLIRHRLQVQNVQFPPLNINNMSWCIPREVKEEPAWRLLLEHPLLFTADMLESLIALDEWNADTPAAPNKSNLLYIRTFQVPVALLLKVLDNMYDEGFGTHDRIHYWQKRIAEEEVDGDVVYTLRYCGQTTGSPWERHRGDMYNQLKTFFGRFLRVLGQTAQGVKVLSSAKVHTVSSTLSHASTETSDLREQILVALFGDGALNTQAGGKDVVTLFKEDRNNFDLLRTNTLRLLATETRVCIKSELEVLSEYSHAVRKYVDKSPATTGSGQFTDQTEAMILHQATPAVLTSNGAAVMVTVGSDLGAEHESAEDTFWYAGGRSADAVTRIYNFFCSWEGPTALEAVDPNAAKNLANSGHLPLVDFFPWFTKNDKDYPKASELLRRYMNTVKPMICLAYGERSIYAGLQSFRDVTAGEFGSWARMGYSHGRAAESGQLYLCYFDGQNADTHDPDTATILIPSLHPGFLSRAGIVKEKATRVFVLTSAIAWCAMSAALEIAREGMPTNREEYVKSIIAKVKSVAGPSTAFGKSLAAACKEYEDCHRAYGEGQAIRRKAPELKIPTGILATKSVRAKRKSRYTDVPVNQSEDGIGGWEVIISKADNFERSVEFYKLTWKEDNDKTMEIAPIPLTKDVVPKKNVKHFIFFVAGGLDIRDADGTSLGLRSPLASGNTKSITLPISAILVAMSVRHYDAAYDLLEHWEDVTRRLFDDEVVARHNPKAVDQIEGSLPASFFDREPRRLGLPFPPASLLTGKTTPKFMAKVQADLPAKPGDLLWLLEQFLLEHFPAGGDIDPVSVSEHPTYSIFGKLMDFAHRTKYEHHPHVNTLKAMAHLSEQGTDERRISVNIILLALEFLRPGYTSKGKQLGRTLSDGTKLSTSRVVRTFNAGPAAATAIDPVTIPGLVQPKEELGEVEDVTDDEAMDCPKDDDDDDDGGDSSDDSDEDDDGDIMDVDVVGQGKRKRGDDGDDQAGESSLDVTLSPRKKRF